MDELLSLLSTTEYRTGEALCETLGMTRAAVWKRMEKLRAEGYQIVASGKRGYRLQPIEDSLLPGYIHQDLHTGWAGRGSLCYRPQVGSTNTLLKEMAQQGAPRGSLVVCDVQTAGKGRLGRAWEAQPGESLLHSLLLCPALPVERAQLCTLGAAVAMAQAIEDILPSLAPRIKWPNDIVIGSRKCVGILSEMSADMDGIGFIVMGIGVNVNQRHFPQELATRATSLWLEGPADAPSVDRRALLCAYLARMEAAVEALETHGLPGILQQYTARSATLGAWVQVISQQDTFTGKATGLDETGALQVQDEKGETRRVLSGDVSVRGVMGYV